MVLQHLFLVFLGGGLGSVCRFLIASKLNPLFENFYLGTFTVNIIGSLLIGFFIGLELKYLLNKTNMLVLVTGFCGGFTTFSAFALENQNLLKSSQFTSTLLYAGLSVIVGIIAVGVGFLIAKYLINS